MPSELLKQFGSTTCKAIFRILPAEACRKPVEYGPYVRKGRSHPSFTKRECICDVGGELICVHLWAEAFQELGIRSAEGMTAGEFNRKLQAACSSVLQPDNLGYVLDWTSHAFRRGSAVDTLQSKGVEAMLRHGEWSSERAAFPYASMDEIDSQRLRAACVAMVDLSDED